MKTMLIAFAAAILIAVAAWFALETVWFDSAEISASPNVRLGDADQSGGDARKD